MVLANHIPVGWEAYEVPGSIIHAAEGKFGKILIQSVRIGPCMMHAITVKLEPEDMLRLRSYEESCVFLFSVDALAMIKEGHFGERHCIPGAYGLGYFPGTTVSFRMLIHDRPSQLLMVTYDVARIKEKGAKIQALAPVIAGIKFKQAAWIQPGFMHSDPVMLELVIKIMQTSYQPHIKVTHLDQIHQLLEMCWSGHSDALEARISIRRERSNRLTLAKLFIDRNIDQPFSVEEVRMQCGMSMAKLRFVFKQAYGCTIRAYIVSSRLERSRALLEYSDMPIKEIADLAGYSNTNNYATAFGKKYDVTPKVFREQLEQKNEEG